MPEDNALTVSSLGSGSNGNAFLIEHGQQRLLVDAGVPIRTLIACLNERGLRPSDISAALISHEHSDHIRALPSLLGKSEFPVFATKGTHAGLLDVPNRARRKIGVLDTFEICSLAVTTIPVAHDARDPVGFAIRAGDTSVTVLTDLGEVSDTNAEFAARADLLIIESNYDERLLRSGQYPAYLKRRIRAADGHLSNEDCARFLGDIADSGKGQIWLCHLSENNNRPELAIEASSDVLKKKGIFRELVALPRYDGTTRSWSSNNRSEYTQQVSLPF